MHVFIHTFVQVGPAQCRGKPGKIDKLLCHSARVFLWPCLHLPHYKQNPSVRVHTSLSCSMRSEYVTTVTDVTTVQMWVVPHS